MPRNGSGSYSLPNNTFYPGVNGITIQTADANTTMADIQSALTASVSADGQTPMTGDLNMGSNRVKSVTNPTALTDAATASDAQTGRLTYLTGVAGTNTITGSLALLAAYATGELFKFIAAGTNTGAVTLNINSIGAKAILRPDGSALSANEIVTGQAVVVLYDGTQFQMISAYQRLLIGTATSLSGTLGADFTGIPSWARQITISYSATTTGDSSPTMVTLGDSGGIEVVGYAGGVGEIGGINTCEPTNSSVGFRMGVNAGQGGFAIGGTCVLTLIDPATFTWAAAWHSVYVSGGATRIAHGAGVKSTSAALDRVRFSTQDRTANFSAGKVNILYE